MQLKTARVTSFKSIDDSGLVAIEPDVTVLVGQNESGKTAFLKALHKGVPIESDIEYNHIDDYPRKSLSDYLSHHENNPAIVSELNYTLSEEEIQKINSDLNYSLLQELNFSVQYKYGGGKLITLIIPEELYVKELVKKADLPSEISKKAQKSNTIKQLISNLSEEDLNAESTKFLDKLREKFGDAPQSWSSLLQYYVWEKHLEPNIPRFLYFDDYKLLPGKVNLLSLKQQTSTNSANAISDENNTVLALLRLAKVDIDDLLSPASYEESKARLEGISNSITDKVFRFWTQNQNLEVQFDIKADPNEQPPFNNGSNLYIRIRNQRHRVSVPFDQRSRGFIWFFSFLVWFTSIKQQIDTNNDLILLLDEPGLSLHALAQADFLNYIDTLAQNHQIIYTTHSPFMVHGDRLHQVRTVEDRPEEGTKVTDNVSSSDPQTLFPLQASLGYTIAQNLFIARKNLLVEGPADLIYLKFFSSILDQRNYTALRDDVIIVPVGGLDKLATFVALLGANQLELVVLHDFESKPNPRLESLVSEKIIRDRNILHYGMFRSPSPSGRRIKQTQPSSMISSDVEDMLSSKLYLKLFCSAYKKELNEMNIQEEDLPPGDRIVDRIGRFLESQSINLRQGRGFNHYRVANYLASNPVAPSRVDSQTLNRFNVLFQSVNQLYQDS